MNFKVHVTVEILHVNRIIDQNQENAEEHQNLSTNISLHPQSEPLGSELRPTGRHVGLSLSMMMMNVKHQNRVGKRNDPSVQTKCERDPIKQSSSSMIDPLSLSQVHFLCQQRVSVSLV